MWQTLMKMGICCLLYTSPFYGVTVYLVNEQDPRYLLAIDILGSDLNAVDQADQFFSVYTE